MKASQAQTEKTERNRLPKLCGADVEWGNFILGVDRQFGTGPEASRALLREINGLPQRSGATGYCEPSYPYYGGTYGAGN